MFVIVHEFNGDNGHRVVQVFGPFETHIAAVIWKNTQQWWLSNAYLASEVVELLTPS